MANISIPIPQETNDQIRQMLEEIAREVIQSVTESENKSKDYMSFKETAAYMGISYNTLRKWVDQEGLPKIIIDGRKFISKKSLIAWLHQHEN